MTIALRNMDAGEWLKSLPDNSASALLSDPPAGISFMGKAWDSNKGGRTQWITWLSEIFSEAHRVLKPGAYGLVWALPRTSHWTATALEDAGFEIRDVVTHLFGTGFPKSFNVSRGIDNACGAQGDVIRAVSRMNEPSGLVSIGQGRRVPTTRVICAPATDAARAWAGYGTALKPASEHWILVRKPMDGTVTANVLEHGTGGLAIDATRIGYASEADQQAMAAGVDAIRSKGGTMANSWKNSSDLAGANPASALGRWPANVTLDESAAELLDVQSGNRPGMSGGGKHRPDYAGGLFGSIDSEQTARGDSGGASRFVFVAKSVEEPCMSTGGGWFLYQPKASTRERNAGCESLPLKSPGEVTGRDDGSAALDSPRSGAGRTSGNRNTHPTLKSLALTRWLATLIKPPMGGKIIVPFAGSGSEMIGAWQAGWSDVEGAELETEYATIAEARIAYWTAKGSE